MSITESASVSDTRRKPPMFFASYSYTWSYRVSRPVVFYAWSCF